MHFSWDALYVNNCIVMILLRTGQSENPQYDIIKTYGTPLIDIRVGISNHTDNFMQDIIAV